MCSRIKVFWTIATAFVHFLLFQHTYESANHFPKPHLLALVFVVILKPTYERLVFVCLSKVSDGQLDDALKEKEELEQTCAELKLQMAQVRPVPLRVILTVRYNKITILCGEKSRFLTVCDNCLKKRHLHSEMRVFRCTFPFYNRHEVPRLVKAGVHYRCVALELTLVFNRDL